VVNMKLMLQFFKIFCLSLTIYSNLRGIFVSIELIKPPIQSTLYRL